MVTQLTEISNTNKLDPLKQQKIAPKIQVMISNHLDNIWSLFKRAIYKVGKIIYSIPLCKKIIDQNYEAKVAQYQASLPKLHAEDQAILDTLNKTGTVAIPIEDLQLESTAAFLEKTTSLAKELKNIPVKEQMAIDLDHRKFKDCPEIFLWGIEERLLNIIEYYIGLPLYYQGCALRRDIVTKNSDINSVRNWHFDGEDRMVVKIIVYLNDVGLDGGHYEYIPKDLSKKAVKELNYDLGYLDDQAMMNVVPQKDWAKCPGKFGTVIITNTSNVFHRAKPPEKEDRFSISFCYTSNKPRFNWNCASFPHNLEQIRNQLSEKQSQVLINKNKFFGMKL
ncbi:MAG: hypothetical protein AAGA80_16255 [Cyanobacteria bacterium P01_F01_bin.143]